ncbi:hypothetical protein G3480_04140 [Thiorhodococcus mannitoliphagus]|uniref:Uncharacterized protein n=1 Tax=Thiorhodococcus mannitoliphagus TaxID=329406 RepID=A0A6P1DNJ0_9GAMM|nr:hypothetical protein [Thiorhodococcus mannitoliphagus]
MSPRTYRRWLSSGNPDPTAVRLLAILAGFVPWSGWDGWEMHNGYLFPPGYQRGGIPPGEFFALVFYRQQVSAYQESNAKLRVELQALKDECERLRVCGRALRAQLDLTRAKGSAHG